LSELRKSSKPDVVSTMITSPPAPAMVRAVMRSFSSPMTGRMQSGMDLSIIATYTYIYILHIYIYQKRSTHVSFKGERFNESL